MKRRVPARQSVQCNFDYEKLAACIPAQATIDYEKLANHIADAISKREVEDRDSYSFSREWMKYIVHAATDVLAVCFGLITLYLLYKMFINVPFKTPFGLFALVQYGKSAIYAMLALFTMTLSMTTFYLGKEIEKEKDRRFVATMFSNVTSLVALIVAFVALVQGVL